jgi:hypothetical protein
MATKVLVLDRDASGCAEEKPIELAGIDNMMVVVGTAMLIGTDEVVFA